MRKGLRISVVIPAFNEENSIGKVIADIPDWVDEIIVADNNSTDRTAKIAAAAGATVVPAPRQGYGSACLAGMAAMNDPDIVVFIDADYSDHPEEMVCLVDPIIDGKTDLVIGSRVLGKREQGALTQQARFGNWLSTYLIRLFWNVRFTDLGPFRAIRYSSLKSIGMCDLDFGWTVEMQIKAAVNRLRCLEVPVSYRKRIGTSKISGTLKGVILAGWKILSTILLAAAGRIRYAKDRSGPVRLVVFTRYPLPGIAKTRLIPALGPEGAANLQVRMTEYTTANIRQFVSEYGIGRNLSVEVRYEGGNHELMRHWLGFDFSYKPQGNGDLGQRMSRAVADGLADGCCKVVIIGTDCPGLTPDILIKAYEALDHSGIVFGPADDGGYYLIGTVEHNPELFQNINWGTDEVLNKSIGAAEAEGMNYRLLNELTDIDLPENLPVWENVINNKDIKFNHEIISIVIPALNESRNLKGTLENLQEVSDIEIIVADGGSNDDTAHVCESFGVKHIISEKGKGTQMNAGAAAANGDILLFLHADTLLPEGFQHYVRRIMKDDSVSCGAFRLGINNDIRGIRLIERATNYRSRKMGLPYGDQAFFVRADAFRASGGFRELPIMEDYEFIRRMRRLGRISVAPAAVLTSGRRWQRLGVFKTTMINQIVIAAYHLGVKPNSLARFYGR